MFLGLAPVFAIAEFGLGNGAINVAAATGETSVRRRIVPVVAMVLAVLCAAIVTIPASLIGGWVGPALIPDGTNVSGESAWALFGLAALSYTGLAVQGVLTRLLYNEGSGVAANLVLSIGSALTLAAIALYCEFGAASLPMALVALNSGGALATVIMAWLVAQRVGGVRGIWNPKEVRAVAVEILGRGSRFWIVSLQAMLMVRLEFVILSQVAKEASEITAYRLLSTLGMFIYILFSAQLIAVSPGMARHMARKAYDEAHRVAVRLMLRSAFLVTGATTVLVLAHRPILNFLSPRQSVALGAAEFVLFGVYLLIRIWTDTHAQLLLSANRFRPIILVLLPAVLVGPASQYLLGRAYGLIGLLCGLSIPYLLFLAGPARILWDKLRTAEYSRVS